ncbi:zinc knuckle [Cooperia oncophora]
MVIFDDRTLIDILGDDHLEGRAKSIFLSLPSEVKRRGFDEVVEELRRLLASDSTAGRLRALAELRTLRRRPDQSVSDFCVALEKSGRQANPLCTVKDRSMEYAQVLLDNLKDWPEYIHLMSALHKVDPREAYDTVKELAVSMEQSKSVWQSRSGRVYERESWKKRGAAYGEVERRVQGEARHRDEAGKAQVVDLAARDTPCTLEDRGNIGRNNNGEVSKERRRCYNCSRFGHIGKDCPLRRTTVKQIGNRAQKSGKSEKSDELARILNKARSLGVKVDMNEDEKRPLVGQKVSAAARLLDMQVHQYWTQAQ